MSVTPSTDELQRKGKLDRLSGNDIREIRTFERFLRAIDHPPPVTRGDFSCRLPGWVPYMLGVGPAPPEGHDHLPVTAWRLPA